MINVLEAVDALKALLIDQKDHKLNKLQRTELTTFLKEEGYETVFFGGPMDREMVEAAISKMKTKPLVATGKFSIGELAAAMSRCQLIITNDSGPMHVAISQKVPIVAMYGPSHPDLYGPYTKDAIIVKAIPPCDGCRSGMKHHCEDMRCMRQLTVDQVLGAAYTMLRR